MPDEFPLIRPTGYLSQQRWRDEQFEVMRAIIKQLEWSRQSRSCPICLVAYPGPHGASCDIGHVLAR